MVRGHQEEAIPVRLLHGDAFSQSPHQVLSALGRKAAKLDHGPPAANRLHAQRLLLGKNGPEAVQIGLTGAMVMRITRARDEGAGLVFAEHEGAGPQHVVLVPANVLHQPFGAVDEVERAWPEPG